MRETRLLKQRLERLLADLISLEDLQIEGLTSSDTMAYTIHNLEAQMAVETLLETINARNNKTP